MPNGQVFNLHLVFEVKGMEDNIDRIKVSAARKWVGAVNNWGKHGAWDYAVVKDLTRIEEVLDESLRVQWRLRSVSPTVSGLPDPVQ